MQDQIMLKMINFGDVLYLTISMADQMTETSKEAKVIN